MEADIYVKKVAQNYGISESALRLEMGQDAKAEEVQRKPIKESDDKAETDITKIEQMVIKVLLTDSSYFKRLLSYEDIFVSETGAEIFKAINEIYDENEEIDIDRLMENLEPKEVETLREIDEGISLGGKTEAIFEDCIRLIERKN